VLRAARVFERGVVEAQAVIEARAPKCRARATVPAITQVVSKRATKTSELPIYVEAGTKRTFATAVEWPGWSRGGRDEQGALAALAAYGDRYAAVVTPAGLKLVPPKEPADFKVVKRVKGNATTDFGVPAIGIPSDDAPIPKAELERLKRILVACWSALDRMAKDARGLELRKGPRGGGRDLDKIVEHVAGAEEMYLTKLGARAPKAARGRLVRPNEAREVILAALRATALGLPIAEPSRVKSLWTPRYFVRRAAWHVLDHVWEIEDRAIRRR
jgi:hypothetical protein